MPGKSHAGERMFAARQEIIERLLKSAEIHSLDEAQLVAVGVHATAATLIEVTGVTRQAAGEALQTSVHSYLAEAPTQSN